MLDCSRKSANRAEKQGAGMNSLIGGEDPGDPFYFAGPVRIFPYRTPRAAFARASKPSLAP